MEHIRTFQKIRGLTLKLYDTYRTDRCGKTELAYKLIHKGKVIFEGDQFYCSPLYAGDSDECALSLLSFLTLKPGDTDQEYFDKYTQDQLDWVSKFAESFQCDIMDMEEKLGCN